MNTPQVTYLDNAATSWPKPPDVARAMADFLARDAANPGRAGHRMAIAAEKMLDRVRKEVSDFIGGADPHWLIFTLNCTDALNIAFKSFLRSGDHVISSMLEHNSVSRPLQSMADSGFITLTRVGFSPETGLIDPDEIRGAITARTRLIALSHAGNVLGTIQPAAAVGKIARDHGVKFLLDVAQTIGVVSIHIQHDQIDFLAFPGHKSLLGPTGTGGLYVNKTVEIEALLAFREGGTGGDSATPVQPRLMPYLLEGGTPNTVGVAGLGAALDYVKKHDPAATLAHERQMVQHFISGVADISALTIYGPSGRDGSANRVGTVSFNLAGYSPQELGGILDETFSIAVRPGLHCAPYAHRVIGTFPDGAVRMSPGHFNTVADIDTLIAALHEVAA